MVFLLLLSSLTNVALSSLFLENEDLEKDLNPLFHRDDQQKTSLILKDERNLRRSSSPTSQLSQSTVDQNPQQTNENINRNESMIGF